MLDNGIPFDRIVKMVTIEFRTDPYDQEHREENSLNSVRNRRQAGTRRVKLTPKDALQ